VHVGYGDAGWVLIARGEAVDFAEEGAPVAGAEAFDTFAAKLGLAVEHHLSEVGEELCVTARYAIGGGELEQFGEHIVNFGHGAEAAGSGGKLGGNGLEVLDLTRVQREFLLLASVEDAESGVGVVAEHAAGAAVSKRELAELGFVRGASTARVFGLECGAHDGGLGGSVVLGRGGTPPGFLDVWQIKDFKSFVYGSVVNKGVMGAIFRKCGKQRS
jgi:hypothetical protein